VPIKDLEFYCKKFAKLRVDRARGIAPHKPILLLAVAELIERGEITQNRIYPSPGLIATFLKYWSYLGSENHHSQMYLPFYHLKGDKFWHLRTKAGLEDILSSFKPKSLETLKKVVVYAYMDDELFLLMCDQNSRHTLINTLIDAWFSDKSDQLPKLFKVDAFQTWQNRLKESGGTIYRVEDLEDEQQNIVRDAAFRRVVVSIYEQRCALCRLQVIAPNGQGIVDGAHIRPFSEFHDDRIVNGLSLCKNHHWAFDRGWFGINENYQIEIDNNLHESEQSPPFLKQFDNSKILLPADSRNHPSRDALQWHYENTYQV
jgi:putative restriction endonuclease